MPEKFPSTMMFTVSAGLRLLANPSGLSTGALALNGSCSSVLMANVATWAEPAMVAPAGMNWVPGGVDSRLIAPLPGVIVSGSEPTALAKTGTESGAGSLLAVDELLVDWKVIGSTLPPNALSSGVAPDSVNSPKLSVPPAATLAVLIWQTVAPAPIPPPTMVIVVVPGAVKAGTDWNRNPEGSVTVKREPVSSTVPAATV